MKSFLLSAALLAACLTLANAQDKSKEKTSDVDQTFVTKAVAGGLAEINFGRLAVKNASNSDVRSFAQRMVEDHSKANQGLLDVLNKQNVKYKIPEGQDADHDKMMKKLIGLSGAAFDKAYVDGQLADHEKAVSLFEKQSKDGKDEKLVSFAKKTLPTLREHLKQAKNLHKTLGETKDKTDKR